MHVSHYNILRNNIIAVCAMTVIFFRRTSTLILIVGFSQYMARVRCPCHSIRRNEEGRVTCIREGSVPFFRLFSVRNHTCAMREN